MEITMNEDLTKQAMIPADDVAQILRRMKIEQEQMMQQQREAIVKEVIQHLHDSGVVHNRCATRPTTTLGQQTRISQHPASALERNLHSLVLHSLDGSGLDYPHVQHHIHVGADDVEHCPKRSNRFLKKSKHGGTQIILARLEQTGNNLCINTESNKMDSIRGERNSRGGEEVTERRNVPAVIQQSPLQASRRSQTQIDTEGRCANPSKNKQGKSSKQTAPNASSPDRSDHVRHSRFDQKTLAILDRSERLLEQTSEIKPSGKSREYGRKAQDRAVSAVIGDAQDRSIIATANTAETPSESSVETNLQEEHGISKPASAQTQEGFISAQSSQAQQMFSRDVQDLSVPSPDSITATDHTPDIIVPISTNPDIELLQPPDHAPQNESEWENELARQILSVYATSVKAKAAAPSRPASGFSLSTTKGLKSTQSCSLPSLSTAKNDLQKDITEVNSRVSVHYSWEPSQRLRDGKVIINMPKVPKPIWFAGTGAVKAVWCALAVGFQGLEKSPLSLKPRGATGAVCDHRLCEEVRRLESDQQYSECITMLEALMISIIRARAIESLEVKLWKQLVVTCNAYASRCIDYKKYQLALLLIRQAEHLLDHSILVDDVMRFELLAYLYDTYAFYYYRRRKAQAGLHYVLKAQEIHTRQRSWSHLAKCRLHIASLLSYEGKHQNAMSFMASILELIEENKLEDQEEQCEGASAQKICLAAVCYNNLAVEQLHLREFEAANVSTGNAQRLARLCLSYCNRWLAQFEATRLCVDLAIATWMEDVNAGDNVIHEKKTKQ